MGDWCTRQAHQAVWNGKDYRGQSISRGVYLVLVDGLKRETTVGKIVLIAK